MIAPYETPLLRSASLTFRPRRCASAIAALRLARKSAVISSASISFRPRPNKCGASRLSGRVATSPPAPADPRGRPWQAAQLSARPAPMARSLWRSPEPSPSNGLCPCARVNFRWKSWRPRRMARKGSRAMMKEDDPGVSQSPRPVPISSSSDFAMPAPAALGAAVRSTSCASAGTATSSENPRKNPMLLRMSSSARFMLHPPTSLRA